MVKNDFHLNLLAKPHESNLFISKKENEILQIKTFINELVNIPINDVSSEHLWNVIHTEIIISNTLYDLISRI